MVFNIGFVFLVLASGRQPNDRQKTGLTTRRGSVEFSVICLSDFAMLWQPLSV